MNICGIFIAAASASPGTKRGIERPLRSCVFENTTSDSSEVIVSSKRGRQRNREQHRGRHILEKNNKKTFSMASGWK